VFDLDGKEVMSTQHLRPYIVQLENVLDSAFCDHVIAEFLDSDEWHQARVGGLAEVDRNTRNVDVIELSSRRVLQRNADVRSAIEQTLLSAAMKAVREYQKLYPDCHIVRGNAFEFLRYTKGGFYRKHTDSFVKEPRSLSCSFALNDDFAGGEWSFFDADYSLSPPKGSVILFPSNFMFPHEILKIRDGVRYSVVTWMI
jgi:predicted 2-oxoglutarate/Fe(II)-dependent dioxygenase YbiX